MSATVSASPCWVSLHGFNAGLHMQWATFVHIPQDQAGYCKYVNVCKSVVCILYDIQLQDNAVLNQMKSAYHMLK